MSPWLKQVVISRILEDQRQDAEIDQIGLVDAGKALDDLGPDSQIAGGNGRMFTGRALAVILTADDDTISGGTLARAGKSGSTCSKTCSLMAGMLLRNGSTLLPAGMMWSVVMLSPSLMTTSARSVSGSASNSGNGTMFGPVLISTASASSGDSGKMMPESSTRYFSGLLTPGQVMVLPRSRGSVITPASPDAAAVSGEQR